MNAEFAVAAGFVQFDVDRREANGERVRDIVIRAIGSQKRARITVWQKHAHVPLEKGDFVVAEGRWRLNRYNGRESVELDASTLVRVPAAEARERGRSTMIRATEDAADPF